MANRLASNIRYLRQIIGLIEDGKFLSQSQFAGLLGISRRTLINWESGEMPNQSHRKAILELIDEKLDIKVAEKVLVEKDIAKAIGPMSIYLFPEMLSGLNSHQRQLLQHLFLKIESLSEETLKTIIDFVDEAIKHESLSDGEESS
ncbi:MAG: helix-turn-helix domain-containing protein [Candidatus Zixiibacteriota bacterium]